jgi:hypothetical protein
MKAILLKFDNLSYRPEGKYKLSGISEKAKAIVHPLQ